MNKKNIYTIIIVGVILIIVFIGVIFFLDKHKSDTKNNEDFISKLEALGSDYYENNFYNTISNKEDLEFLVDTGLSLNLTNVNRIAPISSDLEKELKKRNCDYDKTNIVIYPSKPFDKKDYKIKVELFCE